MSNRRSAAAIIAVGAAWLLLAGAALADKEQIHLTAAGQKAVRSAVLTRAFDREDG